MATRPRTKQTPLAPPPSERPLASSALLAGEPQPRRRRRLGVTVAYPTVGAPILLPRPQAPRRSFFAVLAARHTRRAFAELSVSDLSTLLWFTARLHGTAPGIAINGRAEWEHRIPPSAGGRHPIDIIVTSDTLVRHLDACVSGTLLDRPSDTALTASGLTQSPSMHLKTARTPFHSAATSERRQRGWWWYDSRTNALVALKAPLARAASALAKASSSALSTSSGIGDATMLWFVAHVDRTAAFYNHPESLVWRDTGCLLATVTFVAEALRLACCPVGCTGEPWLSMLLDRPPSVVGVGGCVLGGSG